jgi:xanthine dehydrogenase accessory factor
MAEPDLLTAATLPPLLLAVLERGCDAVVLAAVSHPRQEAVGLRVLVAEGQRTGSFLDPFADDAALEAATAALADTGAEPGLRSLPLGGGGEMVAFLEPHHPPPEMVIVGAGHLAQPLCTLGSLLGLRVRILDDRPEFATRERFPEAAEVRRVDFSDAFVDIPIHPWSHVVLVTRGHRYDFECLRQLLRRAPQPGYLGMIGSRRRVKATFQALLEEGIPRQALGRVHAPIGLDIHGETPPEIAVAVAAEIIHYWRGGSGRPLHEAQRVLDRLLPPGGEKYDGPEPVTPHRLPKEGTPGACACGDSAAPDPAREGRRP